LLFNVYKRFSIFVTIYVLTFSFSFENLISKDSARDVTNLLEL